LLIPHASQHITLTLVYELCSHNEQNSEKETSYSKLNAHLIYKYV